MQKDIIKAVDKQIKAGVTNMFTDYDVDDLTFLSQHAGTESIQKAAADALTQKGNKAKTSDNYGITAMFTAISVNKDFVLDFSHNEELDRI